MDESKSDINRWFGKSAEDVLAEAFHELRDPIYVMTGYLSIINQTEVSPGQLKSMAENLLSYSLHSKQIVDSVYHYMAEKRKEQGDV
jgi:hypothetical protein